MKFTRINKYAYAIQSGFKPAQTKLTAKIVVMDCGDYPVANIHSNWNGYLIGATLRSVMKCCDLSILNRSLRRCEYPHIFLKIFFNGALIREEEWIAF